MRRVRYVCYVRYMQVYAATQPDEAGEAARFVGGSVANVTSAYAEVAALNAELALLEQKRQARAWCGERT